ncbi:hypothetical protein SAMN04488057_1023 [Cyclobacterium lianum]|uniref:Uncharacterized protein n=1 Tax=Cyclobacterium lianum TaxID=388280 RepID=A0A1M7JG67_9BACT|nr:hypothetical protein SAMN04488057_1023 [Cyclobacterium lianum]
MRLHQKVLLIEFGRNPMFSPRPTGHPGGLRCSVRPSGVWFLHSLLVSPATMISADFLAHRIRIYSKTSLGKVNIPARPVRRACANPQPGPKLSLCPLPYLPVRCFPPFGRLGLRRDPDGRDKLWHLIRPHGLSIWHCVRPLRTPVLGRVRQCRHRSLAYLPPSKLAPH